MTCFLSIPSIYWIIVCRTMCVHEYCNELFFLFCEILNKYVSTLLNTPLNKDMTNGSRVYFRETFTNDYKYVLQVICLTL